MNSRNVLIDISKSPSAAHHPITGGVEPAIPPMTIFCVLDLFNQIVYMNT